MPAAEKVEAVKQLAERFERATSVVVADYRGLNVEQINRLRKQMREASVECKIAKNRLVKLAVQASGYDALDDVLQGPSALAFGYDDVVTPAKVIAKFGKDNEFLKIKGGWLDRRSMTVQTIEDLARMPSREELLGRLVGSLNSPVTKLAMGLKQTVSKIAYALQAVSEAKQAHS